MTKQQAVDRATGAAPSFEIPPNSPVNRADRRIIEVFADNRSVREGKLDPGPVWDRIAWLVTFQVADWSAELAVDDNTGAIIRLRRFRS
jgi:hypothetical protein